MSRRRRIAARRAGARGRLSRTPIVGFVERLRHRGRESGMRTISHRRTISALDGTADRPQVTWQVSTPSTSDVEVHLGWRTPSPRLQNPWM